MAGTTTIVVVDDAAEVRALVRTWLRLSGRFAVVGEGGTGVDAIALAAEHRPDAMLLDAVMPELGGLDAISRILDASPGTKVVVYSGVDQPGLAERALRLGAVGFVEKTVPMDELANRLAQTLAQDVVSGAQQTQRDVKEAQRQSEERFRQLVEGVSDYAIFMLDRDGHIASWNLGAQRIKGYTSEEAVGQHFRIFYAPDAQQARRPERELEVAQQEGRYEEEGWRVRKDGSQFWANVVITAIRNPSGELVGYAKVTRDITERREMLQERERVTAELATANAQLAAANAELARAAEDKTQFLAVTAHELRTPIRVITGAAGTLADHWDDLDDSERAELIESMRTSSGRMRRLLDDLLIASRLEAGTIDVRTEPTLLQPLLVETVGQILTAYPHIGISIECAPDIMVLADPGRLEQILANYLANAARYGGPPVQIDVATAAGEVVIAVVDHGPGVPAELERRLFERFARGAEDRGTGLGLFIVRELARAQGGTAWYERRGGVSCFAVRLPAS